MRVLRGDWRTWDVGTEAVALTVGVYDGIHVGHQQVLTELMARSQGFPTAVLTFERHPMSISAPEHAPQLLMSQGQKLSILEDLGVDIVGLLEFDLALRTMAPEQFVRRVLVETMRARVIVVGTDFRFGYERGGDIELLRRLAPELGLEVDGVDLVGGAMPFSSTTVRQVLDAGDVIAAADLLGRPFALRGDVVHGDGRGSSIGFPTANLALPPAQLVPRQGVYAAVAVTESGRFPAVLNIGTRPTFGGTREVVEVHLLDFAGDLYRTEMTVELVARIRSEQKFDGIDELVAQIEDDVQTARTALEGHL